jgi:aryl-alcohol dehydrogenase (NADP+)
MEYRRLGASGLEVSPLCLGTMDFGEGAGERTAGRIVAMAREAGVNFIDTADVNAGGLSERIVGQAVRRDRDRWVLATKSGNSMGPGPNQSGMGRKWILQAIDGSLRRLGTDYVDIYYLDIDDAATPLEETIGALGDLIRLGKVRSWGFSNFPAWRIAEMMGICGKIGVSRPVAAQPCYNAVTRLAELDTLPACVHFGIGVVTYSPLARGVLTGKYAPGAAPPRGSRAGRGDKRMLETEFRHESLIIARKIKARARERGMTAAQFAVNWVLNNTLVTSVVAGPRTARQWSGYLGALKHPFTAGDEAFVDGLVRPGHASTPGFVDPRYPVTGRRPRVG